MNIQSEDMEEILALLFASFTTDCGHVRSCRAVTGRVDQSYCGYHNRILGLHKRMTELYSEYRDKLKSLRLGEAWTDSEKDLSASLLDEEEE